jgi:hypothetical protein
MPSPQLRFTTATLLLIVSIGAFSAPIVDLQILNATGAKGEFIVVAGGDVEARPIVTLDLDGVLDKKGKLQLVDLECDMAASSKKRSNSTSGSAILTIRNGIVAARFCAGYEQDDNDSESIPSPGRAKVLSQLAAG